VERSESDTDLQTRLQRAGHSGRSRG
jgi:hypothetical protein